MDVHFEEELNAIENEIDEEVAEVSEWALKSPQPDIKSAYTGVFVT